MPDKRKHRGAGPKDRDLFSTKFAPVLAKATAHLSWLFDRGYSQDASLKLVGDRFQLTARQRVAIRRCSAKSDRLREQQRRELQLTDLKGRTLHIDGFNLLTSLEAALAGGLVIIGVDGCYRDMASMHGSYRKVEETLPALEFLGRFMAPLALEEVIWYLDRPVSNAGRLAGIIRTLAEESGWPWQVEVVPDPDKVLVDLADPIVSADRIILENAGPWVNLARHAITSMKGPVWILDFSNGSVEE